MDETQDLSSPREEDLGAEVLEQTGYGEPTEEIIEEVEPKTTTHMKGDGNSGNEANLPLGVKKRLGMAEKRHQREMRQMRERLSAMEELLTHTGSSQQQSNPMINDSYGTPDNQVTAQIHKAVELALKAQDEQKRQAKDEEHRAYVRSKYNHLENELDKGSDKYDDFDDVVRSHDAPFTPAMRDAALLLDNPAEVLYKLGKNKDELKRIASLPAVEQAKEMVKLSHALMSGNSNPKSEVREARPLGNVKSYPVNPRGLNDNTPVSEIRRRMKSGEWKSRS